MLYQFDTQGANTATFIEGATDEQLMAAVTAKNEAALVSLYDRHMPLLRTIVSRVLNNDSDVEDIIQQIFVEIWNQAPHYDVTKGKALGWLVTLARRRSIDRLRKKQAYYRAEERLRLETKSTADSFARHGADEDCITTDRSVLLNGIIETLPEAQRDALKLAFYSGMSQREIVAKTGIPLGTIKTRIELALRKVRNAVMSHGGIEEWTCNRA